MLCTFLIPYSEGSSTASADSAEKFSGDDAATDGGIVPAFEFLVVHRNSILAAASAARLAVSIPLSPATVPRANTLKLSS